MLKASSLGNAIFVCLVISIFSGCLVLLSHYNNLLNKRINFRTHLINTNNASFTYYVKHLDQLQYNQSTPTDIFEEDLITLVEKKKWGFYDIINCKTIFKQDTITKTALLGKTHNSNFTTLYLTDYDKVLKLSGSTKLAGNIKTPKGTTGEAYINGNIGNTISVKAKKYPSEDKLPKTQYKMNMSIREYKILPFSYYNTNTIINNFDSETIVIDLSRISYLRDIVIKGNIILYSSGTLTIANTAILNDVVVMAKNIITERGFSGNLQIIAKNDVTIKENTQLKYPSSIYVKNDLEPVSVTIDSSSIVAGGIIIDGDSYNNSKQRELIVKPTSRIYGMVYCYGKTQLQGEVIGQLYTDRFFLKTQSAEYENIILNGVVDSDSLPKHFLHPHIFNTNNSSYDVIKTF